MIHRIMCRIPFPNMRMLSTTNNDVIPVVRKEQIGSCGVLSLHRPEVMNALNIEMFELISPQLIEWERDPSIKSILIKGRDMKVFSAGGEIKKVLDVNLNEEYFFSHLSKEYSLVHLFSMLQTPCVSLWCGITMGGGVGIAYHSKYRIASDNTLCSLPETALGFFPDVGATYFLPRLPGYVGMYLGLTGAQLRGREVVTVGLASHFVPGQDLELFQDKLSSVGKSEEVESLVNKYRSLEKESNRIEENLEKINYVFSCTSVERMLDVLSELGDEWSQKTKDRLLKMSPTSLKVTHRALSLGGKLTLQDCLHMESQLSVNFVKKRDLFVGIRGVLVDKVSTRLDWDPATLDDVSEELVMSHFVGNPRHIKFYQPSILKNKL